MEKKFIFYEHWVAFSLSESPDIKKLFRKQKSRDPCSFGDTAKHGPVFSTPRALVGWAHATGSHPGYGKADKMLQSFSVTSRVRAACRGKETRHWGSPVSGRVVHWAPQKTEPASPYRPSCGPVLLSSHSSRSFAVTSPVISKYPILLNKEEKCMAKWESILFTLYSGVFVLIYLL